MNDVLLADYCDKFLGFGSWKAPIFFIGIEEAGGQNLQDVENRLRTWDKRGRKSLEDAFQFYPASGNTSWHGPNAEIQPTWKQLVRMLLLAKGQADTQSAILDYQRNQLGSADGETCLMELLPLPSPNTRDWNYGQWARLPWLQNRNTYIGETRARRENILRRQINRHTHKVIIFYGLTLPECSLLPSWASIAGGHFEQAIKNEPILLCRKNASVSFFITRHPVAESDEYFRKIGIFLRDNHGSLFSKQ